MFLGKEELKNIIIILGTRPEAIKLAPVILELKKWPDKYHVITCNTGQQKEMSKQALSFFDLIADINLNVMQPNQTLAGVQARILSKLSDVYVHHKIDATIVQGDTMTVFCGALVSFYNKVPVFHVEAGLRSYDMSEPFPEEAMRQMTTRIADLHFVPTEEARKALLKENIASHKIVLTGNTVIDALYCLSPGVLQNAERKLTDKGVHLNDKLVLITVHRRENHGERLDSILASIVQLAQRFTDHQFVVPVHPNPNVKDKTHEVLGELPNAVLTQPLDYPELVSLLRNAKLVLTDSGGIQEEAPTFGVPVLVMRYETERKEGVVAGYAKLVGADENIIFREASDVLLQEKAKTRLDDRNNPYGNGRAAEKIQESIDYRFR